MSVLISGLQNRVKNSAAYAEELGLMLIANGEEKPYLLSSNGEIVSAGISSPVAAPTVADSASGNVPNGKYVVYIIAYVSENSFPLVEARIFSNPSPKSAAYHVTGSGDRKLAISFHGSANTLVTHVYLYRTAPAVDAASASLAADAGLLNFVDKIANANSSLSILDNSASVIGNEAVDFTNFEVPQFRFVVWDGSYFWGFANHPFRAQATWDTDGTFTLNNPSIDKFFGGRNNQFITFDSIKSGGTDGRGTFFFQQTGDFTGKVIDQSGADLSLPTSTSGNIVIIGESATLYRSAYRNPFAWGYLQNIAGSYIPNVWQLKVSGSLGTAIAIIPDQQLIKLDMEFPALCVTFALQTATTDVFASTKRQVSRLYSITSHFSQFNAVSKGRQVLWGMDYKNLAIVECDGYTQVPVSGAISILLRKLSKNRSLHLLAHGVYDPVTEINAIWLSSSVADAENALYKFDICVYQHAPTGFWGVFSDYGVLSSAAIEDVVTSQRSILVGTENGYLGKAFDESTYGNWLPSNSIYEGFICYANNNSITRSDGQDDFNPLDGGLIGNYCILVDANGMNVQIVRISGVTSDTLTFEQTLNPIPTITEDTGLVDGQWKFFIGLIELRMLKYFNDGVPSVDKVPREYWATLVDTESPRLEYYPEHSPTPNLSIALQQDNAMDAWFTKFLFPSLKGKSYGLALVDRSFNPTKFFDFTQSDGSGTR